MNDDQKIKELVEAIGWRRIIMGLSRYAADKEELLKGLGLFGKGHDWDIIRQKLLTIRKSPQC